jgi:hypothetical protein
MESSGNSLLLLGDLGREFVHHLRCSGGGHASESENSDGDECGDPCGT